MSLSFVYISSHVPSSTQDDYIVMCATLFQRACVCADQIIVCIPLEFAKSVSCMIEIPHRNLHNFFKTPMHAYTSSIFNIVFMCA